MVKGLDQGDYRKLLKKYRLGNTRFFVPDNLIKGKNGIIKKGEYSKDKTGRIIFGSIIYFDSGGNLHYRGKLVGKHSRKRKKKGHYPWIFMIRLCTGEIYYKGETSGPLQPGCIIPKRIYSGIEGLRDASDKKILEQRILDFYRIVN